MNDPTQVTDDQIMGGADRAPVLYIARIRMFKNLQNWYITCFIDRVFCFFSQLHCDEQI